MQARKCSMRFRMRSVLKLWVALAEAESELGLPVTREQVDELKKYQSDINYDVAEAYEREVRHDVMAHVKAYGEQAKIAAPIIHLGATSCYVNCSDYDRRRPENHPQKAGERDGQAEKLRAEI